MEAILNNILDPSWWFTGLFFTALLYVVPRALKRTQSLLKGTLKGFALRKQKKIKSSRFNQSLVNYEIAKANSYFLIFIMACCFYLTWFIIGPFKSIIELSPVLGAALSAPIYIVEIVWLRQDSFAKELAKSRGRVA